MGTFVEMKTRIANELLDQGAISDGDIENAIRDAVKLHERRKFYFNQALSNSIFVTVAGSENYGESSLIASPKIVSLSITVDGINHPIKPWSFEEIEDMQDGTVTGRPYAYCIWRQYFRLYPIPNDAWYVNVNYYERMGELEAADDENVWTTEAEGLIRQCAKRLIALDILHDEGLATRCAALEKEQLDRLQAETQQRNPNTVLKPAAMLSATSFDIYTGE